MDQAPAMDPNAMRPEFDGDAPPQMAGNDPAYPPMQGYEGVGFGQFSKYTVKVHSLFFSK